MYNTKRLFSLLALLALAASAQAADKVKIGFLSTLSGPGAGLGVDIRDGFNLAVKQLSGKLGGLPAEILLTDDQQKPDVAQQATEKFIKKEKVDFMTGIVFSNIMLAVGHWYENREDTADVQKVSIPLGFKALLEPYRFIPL